MKYQPTPSDLQRDAAWASAIATIKEWPKATSLDEAVGRYRDASTLLSKVLVGVEEIGKTNDGYWVQKIQSETRAWRQSWCMSAAQYVSEHACTALGLPDIFPYDTAGTQLAAAWAEARACTCPIQYAGVADWFIWRSIADPAHGHVGPKRAPTPEDGALLTFEGNTSNSDPNNGGAFEMKRYSNGTGAIPKYRTLRCVIDMHKCAVLAWKDVKW